MKNRLPHIPAPRPTPLAAEGVALVVALFGGAVLAVLT